MVLRVATEMAFAKEGQTIPFYLQPHLGGHHRLRGFARYRFHDANALIATAEHRWHVFQGGHAAIFMDAGKVAPKKSQINFHDLEVAFGFGLRFSMQDRVFMRIEVAGSREGVRVMWTFDNVF